MKKFRGHCVGYVASLIWEAFGGNVRSFDEIVRDFRTINEREGFEVEYIPRGLPRGNWIRVEGVRLTPSEMEAAISQAKEWIG
jgi:hypothetical protein